MYAQLWSAGSDQYPTKDQNVPVPLVILSPVRCRSVRRAILPAAANPGGFVGQQTRVQRCTKYGHARTSTGDQTTALKRARSSRIFEDQGLPGASVNLPALSRCLKTLRAGDTLIVSKLDRLGRSLRARGVKFNSLTRAIDAATPTGHPCGGRSAFGPNSNEAFSQSAPAPK
jgi:hypothetical protein